MQAEVSCGLSKVSVMARMSIFFENNKLLSDAALPRTDRTFYPEPSGRFTPNRSDVLPRTDRTFVANPCYD